MLSIEVLNDGGVHISGQQDDLRALSHAIMLASMMGEARMNLRVDGHKVQFVINRENEL